MVLIRHSILKRLYQTTIYKVYYFTIVYRNEMKTVWVYKDWIFPRCFKIQIYTFHLNIAAAMGALIKWLKSIVSVCNEKMGEPYRKCIGSFDSAHQRCKYVLNWFSWNNLIILLFIYNKAWYNKKSFKLDLIYSILLLKFGKKSNSK